MRLLVAYDHFQLYHVDPDLLFALGAIQRKFYQNGIVIHFGSSFATTDWAANPPRTVYLIIHHAASSPYNHGPATSVWLLILRK